MTPQAIHHEEPTCRVVWETIDQETVRISWADVEGDWSDGVPAPIEPESSRTVAVTMLDLDAAATVLEDLARQDRIPLTTFGVPVDERTPRGQLRSIRLCISDWWRFSRWFPGVLWRAEKLLFQRLPEKKATAVVFRLRVLAQEVAKQDPTLNHLVLCLE